MAFEGELFSPAPKDVGGVEYCIELGMLGTDAAPPCTLSNGDGSICELSMWAPALKEPREVSLNVQTLKAQEVTLYTRQILLDFLDDLQDKSIGKCRN